MTEIERLSAVEAIRQAKARYLRGVDTGDGALVRSVLATDCVLDYRGCCTDPASGEDLMPAMNIVLRGREAWPLSPSARGLTASVHQAHHADIEISGEASATAITAFSDRLFLPAGGDFSVLTGYGFYHECYEKGPAGWAIKTLRISRLRVETA